MRSRISRLSGASSISAGTRAARQNCVGSNGTFGGGGKNVRKAELKNNGGEERVNRAYEHSANHRSCREYANTVHWGRAAAEGNQANEAPPGQQNPSDIIEERKCRAEAADVTQLGG